MSTTNTIIATIYNFIYDQIFTHIWKPQYANVIVYEQMIGITNCNKRSKHRPKMFNYLSNILVVQNIIPMNDRKTFP